MHAEQQPETPKKTAEAAPGTPDSKKQTYNFNKANAADMARKALASRAAKGTVIKKGLTDKLRHHMTTEEFFTHLKRRMLESDTVLLSCLDRVFGKAPLNVNMNHSGLAGIPDEKLNSMLGNQVSRKAHKATIPLVTSGAWGQTPQPDTQTNQ